MAVVRELITLLGTELDPKGFQQYEVGIARVKELALGVGKLLGLAFSVDKILEFADGLIDAGKEINKIKAQLDLVARPMDDMNEAQKQVFATAQNLGVAYKDVLETFKQFSTEMRETKIPQDEIVKTTQNIYEALRVERASPEKIQEVMSVFERTFKRGAMRSVGVGQLFGLSPQLFSMLEKAFNTNEEGLRALAKEGKITAEAITKAFGQTNADLDAKFAKVPEKIGIVFIKIYNDLVNATAQIYKMVDASVFMGRVIWNVWLTLKYGVLTLVDAMGGLESAIQLVGIALALVFGPKLLQMLAMATVASLRWAAANWAAVLPWIAMAAAIAGVALAIQDIVYWIQGKRNFIGTWVGSFADLKKNFEGLDIFSGFRGLKDLFTGDFQGFVKEWKIFVKDTPAEVLIITTAIGTIGAAFLLLFPTIRALMGLIRGIAPEATKVATEIEATAAAKNAKDAITTPGKTLTGEPMPGPRSPAAGGVGYALNILDPLNRMMEDRARAAAGLPPLAKPLDALMQTDTGKKVESGWQGFRQAVRDGVSDGFSWLKDASKWPGYEDKPQGFTGDRSYEPPKNWTDIMPGPGAFGPQTPGPVTNNTNPVFNQNVGGITVNSVLDGDQIARAVNDKLKTVTGDGLNAFARDIQTSSPRIEAATQ